MNKIKGINFGILIFQGMFADKLLQRKWDLIF